MQYVGVRLTICISVTISSSILTVRLGAIELSMRKNYLDIPRNINTSPSIGDSYLLLPGEGKSM